MRHALITASAAGLIAAACTTTADTADEAAAAADAGETMTAAEVAAASDPYLWLEEVESEDALAQVTSWNERSLDRLKADPRFSELEADALAIVNAQDKIAYGAYRGGHVYNFWQDETHVKGLVRRTSLDSYVSDDPQWETLLDVDALSASEDANWVYKGSSCRAPEYVQCLVTLSNGGKDASERREWNHDTQEFVTDGFYLPEAKAGTSWKDADTLYVGTDWGDGTLTESGYPFVVKELKRGQDLADARELIRGAVTDVGVWPFSVRTDAGDTVMMASRSVTFYESEVYWLPDDAEPVQLPIPAKSSIRDLFKDQLILSLEEDWTPVAGGETFAKGALVSFDLLAWMDTGELGPVQTIYAPDERSSIEGVTSSKSKMIVTVYENVIGGAYAFDLVDGVWTRERMALPDKGSLGVVSAYSDSDIVFVNQESFIAPDTLWKVDMASGEASPAKAAPARFDADDLTVAQFEAISSDGERIPYFVIHKSDIEFDGTNPTLLYGYGGFQVSLTPSYSGLRGKLWLERGGVYVLANIRGGGEFGPKWHQAGLKTNRQLIYDDFIAVAENLIEKGITSPRRLGIMGGSNGGLLMGVMFTQRPDLWNAVVCQVPLLDMLRYHTLLAGASWMGEYGDPDIAEEREFLERISPYHNIDATAEYPEMFLVTSTKDDRVHPAHARKMAARLDEFGVDFLYYENIDGGHSAAANLKETAKRVSLEYVYLMQKLMD